MMLDEPGDLPESAHSCELRQRFCTWQPEVTATFGGNDALFRQWWRTVTRLDAPDEQFLLDYSSNDRFLKNRLILPEEIPFLVLPILKAVLTRQYQEVIFIERGTHPYLWAFRHLITEFCVPARPRSLRVKGLMRETFGCNLLSLLAMEPKDHQFFTAPLTPGERDCISHFLAPAAAGTLQYGTREDVLRLLADEVLDPRIKMPNVLKYAVFLAGNLMRSGPLTAADLIKAIEPSIYELAPNAYDTVTQLVERATSADGQICFPRLLDGMNDCVRQTRAMIQDSSLPALNALLNGTRTARAFSSDGRVLVIEEVSVCGSTCLALDVLSSAFNPDYRFDFGAVVGMWAQTSFLDVASASFSVLKPLEDVPYLSPNCFVPVYSDSIVRQARPQRFPSCVAITPLVRYWKQTLFERIATPHNDADDINAVISRAAPHRA